MVSPEVLAPVLAGSFQEESMQQETPGAALKQSEDHPGDGRLGWRTRYGDGPIAKSWRTGAMREFIEIRGARENNLKDVSLRIPKRR